MRQLISLYGKIRARLTPPALKPVICLLVLLGAWGATPLTNALDYSLALELQEEYSDNVDRRPKAQAEEEFTHIASLFAGVQQEGQRFATNANYQLMQREYQRNVFDDETILTGTGSFEARLIPSRLLWRIDHNRQQQAQNTRAADTPQNRQEASFLSTGPTVQFRPSRVDTVAVSLTGSRLTQVESNNDNFRYRSTVDWSHAMNRTLSLGLRGNLERVEFDTPFNPDFTSLNGAVTIERSGRRLSVSGNVGYQETRRQGQDEINGLSVDLTTALSITEVDELSLTFSRQIDDNSNQNFGNQDFGFLNGNVNLGQVAIRTSTQIRYTHQGHRYSANATVSLNSNDFDGQFNDQEVLQFTAGANYRLGRSSTVNSSVTVQDQSFESGGGDRTTYSWTLGFSQQLSEKLRLAANVRLMDQDGQSGTLAEFQESRYSVSIRYQLRQLPTVAGRRR